MTAVDLSAHIVLLKDVEAFFASTLQRPAVRCTAHGPLDIHKPRARPQQEVEPEELPHKQAIRYSLCWVPPAEHNKREKNHIPRKVVWLLNQDRMSEAFTLWKTIEADAASRDILSNRKTNKPVTMPCRLSLSTSDIEWFTTHPGLNIDANKSDGGVTAITPDGCPVADAIKTDFNTRLVRLANFREIVNGHFHVVDSNGAVLGVEHCALCDVKTLI
jgi:hypothetical protein